jgi:hypothetical protein
MNTPRADASGLVVTVHAIVRYQQRVDGNASPRAAAEALAAIATRGRRRTRARHWMRGTIPTPGTVFVYSAASPGVCLLVREHTIVTVLSRASCRRWRASQAFQFGEAA